MLPHWEAQNSKIASFQAIGLIFGVQGYFCHTWILSHSALGILKNELFNKNPKIELLKKRLIWASLATWFETFSNWRGLRQKPRGLWLQNPIVVARQSVKFVCCRLKSTLWSDLEILKKIPKMWLTKNDCVIIYSNMKKTGFFVVILQEKSKVRWRKNSVKNSLKNFSSIFWKKNSLEKME